MAWLEGAWLLTFSVEFLASKRLRPLILPMALSCTAALSELVKFSSIWEERSCWCALGADMASSRSSTARLPGWTLTVRQGCLGSRAYSGVPAPRVPRRLGTNSPGTALWPGRKADATLCRHCAPEEPAGQPLVTKGGGQPPCSVLSLHATGVRTMHSRVDTPFPPG